MDFVAAHSTHHGRDFGNIADFPRKRLAFHIKARLSFRPIVTVVRDVGGSVLYQVIVRIKTEGSCPLARLGDKSCAFSFGQLKIYGLEEPSVDEPLRKILQNLIFFVRPLLYVEHDIVIVETQIICGRQIRSAEHPLHHRIGYDEIQFGGPQDLDRSF